MKQILLFAFTILLNFNARTQDTIRFIGFEGDSLQWKGKGIGSGLISDSLSLLKGDTLSGAGDIPSNQRILSGKRSWQVNNINDTLLLDSVIVGIYDSVRLKLRFTGTSTNNGQGLDNDDSVKIFVAVNGMSFPSKPQIAIIGSNKLNGEENAKWGFTADSIVKTNYDTCTVFSTPNNGSDTLTASSTAIINFFKPGTTSIRVMIVAFSNKNTEFWNVDNIVLEGKKRRALAIKGMSFNLAPYHQGVLLNWIKFDETDCLKYTVQHSHDDQFFEDISTIHISPKENQVSSYSYNDVRPVPGWNYYRIKLDYMDGTMEYTNIKSVYLNHTASFFVFPTLAHDQIHLVVPKFQEFSYSIIDISGKLFRNIHKAKDEQIIPVNELPQGVYFLVVKSGAILSTYKFVRL